MTELLFNKRSENYKEDQLLIEKFDKDLINDFLDYHYFNLTSILSILEDFQSPIEKKLGFKLITKLDVNYGGFFGGGLNEDFVIIPQEHVYYDKNKKYILDFCIHYKDEYGSFKIAIECDGHDFHERTKEQAAKDRSRDRNLIKMGYIVLRFTGSEIYNDVKACEREVYAIVCKEINKLRGNI